MSREIVFYPKYHLLKRVTYEYFYKTYTNSILSNSITTNHIIYVKVEFIWRLNFTQIVLHWGNIPFLVDMTKYFVRVFVCMLN